MSLPVSVGDVIAITKLLVSAVSSLRAASRAEKHYKDLLLSEIGLLQRTLQDIAGTELERESDGVRLAAAGCKEVLEEILGRLRKYEVLSSDAADEEELGEDGNRSSKRRRIAKLSRKVQWGFTIEKEIKAFREKLAPRVACLQMQLITAGVCDRSFSYLDCLHRARWIDELMPQ